MTPDIKTKLRKKNQLMRAGRLEEAGALAARIGNDITRHNKIRLMKTSSKSDAKDVWTAVRQLTGRTLDVGVVDGVNRITQFTSLSFLPIQTIHLPSKSSQSLISTISKTYRSGRSFIFWITSTPLQQVSTNFLLGSSE